MPYVRRNSLGEIESVHRAAGAEALEYLDGADPELMRFFNVAVPASAPSSSDHDFIRVVEDLMDLLVAKGVVNIEELPDDAQAKWVRRKEERAKLARQQYSASGFVEIIDDSSFNALRDLPR